MTIDVNAAGLLAQVIPALLVFLALEDRLSPTRIPGKVWRHRLTRWREVAVVLNLISLAICLIIVMTKMDIPALGLFVALSVAILLVVLSLLFAGMFGREDEPEVESVDTAT